MSEYRSRHAERGDHVVVVDHLNPNRWASGADADRHGLFRLGSTWTVAASGLRPYPEGTIVVHGARFVLFPGEYAVLAPPEPEPEPRFYVRGVDPIGVVDRRLSARWVVSFDPRNHPAPLERAQAEADWLNEHHGGDS